MLHPLADLVLVIVPKGQNSVTRVVRRSTTLIGATRSQPWLSGKVLLMNQSDAIISSFWNATRRELRIEP